MASTALADTPVNGAGSTRGGADETIQVVVDEASGTVKVNGAVVNAGANGPDGAPLYSTGATFVGAGDIYWRENAAAVSDMIRIYGDPAVSNGAYGNTFSVWSDLDPLEPADGDIFDRAFPGGISFNFPNITINENEVYTTAFSTWQFNSDVDVPEPASVSLLAVGAAGLLVRRRTAPR